MTSNLSIFEKLKEFFEKNPLAVQAAKPISNGRQIELALTSDGETKRYTFQKADGRNIFLGTPPDKPDLVFQMPEIVACELAEKKFETVGAIGLFIFEKMMVHDDALKVHVQLKAGLLSFLSGGYLGVLKEGGAEVTKFLGERGFGSLGKIKDLIVKFSKSR